VYLALGSILGNTLVSDAAANTVGVPEVVPAAELDSADVVLDAETAPAAELLLE
jgi:hypothetical protein